ncbi:quinoprotein dehydrogenase-associated SoxYZ-like carrier [Profundibacter amoris]|uniref:Quinoprotein dehydrogenase-associated SoxYZ-like carrier n=1 Tax=Profundibacter amoris TaxID=2171755 RepID=A0A347UCU6_9RHOB|nr:quinoprotein dehydrogenase-associated SoxYZ-like carrier [Profundibacter amoris]AXX96674.1 quinoprotein dehydrogenase-associated SoxYZ-like carrier [Profundibacter amoris]
MKNMLIGAALAALMSTGAIAGEAVKNPLVNGETWTDLKYDVVEDMPLIQSDDLFTLDAPFRAFDAATVPVHITQSEGSEARIEKLILVVDENPSPLVAEFTFGENMGALDFETRVRVNSYSNVRAIGITEGGDAYMTGRYVKASGGCSAPASKDAAAALASLGKMKIRQFDDLDQPAQSSADQTGQRRVAQIMIKHPNYSGLSRDQITHLFVLARFIDVLKVYQGDDLLFKMEAGISISEDPSFRFTYTDNGSDTLRIYAEDTEGEVFEQTFPKDKIAM